MCFSSPSAPPPAPPPPTPQVADKSSDGANSRRSALEEARKKRGMASTILGGKPKPGTILGMAQMNDAMKTQLGE